MINETPSFMSLIKENKRLKEKIEDRKSSEESLAKWVYEQGKDNDKLKGRIKALEVMLRDKDILHTRSSNPSTVIKY